MSARQFAKVQLLGRLELVTALGRLRKNEEGFEAVA